MTKPKLIKKTAKKKALKYTHACSSCGASLTADELITVENPEWVCKPIDDECCPYCKGLAIEVKNDEE